MASGRGVRLGGLGIGGVLVLMVLGWALTGSPLGLLGGDEAATETEQPSAGPPTDVGGKFVSTVLADTEDTWDTVLARINRRYERPKLVLYTDATPSACGYGSAASGPFYCPQDRKVYLDLGFFRELEQRFGAPGDFARAYVIAHEVGHHVQNLLGVFEGDTPGSRAQANAESITRELQADCLAGVWGFYAAERGILQPGDADEGLKAAAAIGDDRLQRQAQGRVTPETWTHGSSQQRVGALRRGLESGQLSACGDFK